MLLDEFFVIGFCLMEYWNIRIGIFPLEEIIVGFAGILVVSLHAIRLGNTELRKGSINVPPTGSAMAQEFPILVKQSISNQCPIANWPAPGVILPIPRFLLSSSGSACHSVAE